MTEAEAVRKALEYVQATALEVGPVVEVKYVDLSHLDEKAKDCPPDLLETYNSVRKTFRNQWVVTFERTGLDPRFEQADQGQDASLAGFRPCLAGRGGSGNR